MLLFAYFFTLLSYSVGLRELWENPFFLRFIMNWKNNRRREMEILKEGMKEKRKSPELRNNN